MKYEVIEYPDGQLSVKILDANGRAEIRERINSYKDLFKIAAIREAYKSFTHINELLLYIPCLFGQRSDRRFSDNQSFDLKIIANFINSLNFTSVSLFDTHSDVSLALINNSSKISSFEYVKKTVENINSSNLVLVSPDAGAYKKVFEYGEQLGLEVVAANKHRNKDGVVDLKFMGDVKDKDCLICDDLCDGGYTFLKLGESLKQQGASKVYLYVSHGYFSKGFAELKKVLDGIFCTNSVKDIEDRYYDGYNMKSHKGFITQYKVI